MPLNPRRRGTELEVAGQSLAGGVCVDAGGGGTAELAGAGGCDEAGGAVAESDAEADGIADSVLAGRVDASGTAAVGACDDVVPEASEVAGGDGCASDSADEVRGTSLLAGGGAPDEEGGMYVLIRVELGASAEAVEDWAGTEGV